jgi:alkanesulfonate monooxygenase SsuD/methylene tetrahydromethanopterin reductase-like flavin-dependent oxidoreductase (luciferase family)
VIADYNHPSRTAEAVAMMDLTSDGRVEFGVGEGVTRLELQGYGIPSSKKRDFSLEAAEQVANMMTTAPYPEYEAESFSMPCRNVVPKPLQKPHLPMWLACTNRKTIEVAARNGFGAVAFSFVAPEEAKSWADTYYSIIKSEDCVPLGHMVHAHFAMVAGFSLHPNGEEATRLGPEGFEFFGYPINALVANDSVPGRTRLWEEYMELQGRNLPTIEAPGTGTPAQYSTMLRGMQDAGVDQVIFLQQDGRISHEHICDSLELFAGEVMPEFVEGRQERQPAKATERAPFIEQALTRKLAMPELADDEIPVVPASQQREAFYHRD